MLMNPNKKAISILVGKLKAPSFVQKPGEPSGGAMSMPEPTDSDYGLQSAADKLISAVHAKDSSGVVSALKDIFAMMDGSEDQGSGD